MAFCPWVVIQCPLTSKNLELSTKCYEKHFLKKREHLITMQVLSSLYANGTSLLCLRISKKTPNMAFVVLTLQARLRSGSEWCPEQLRSCSNPQAEHLSVSHIAGHLEISCKVECWMFNNHPELFFLNFWKSFLGKVVGKVTVQKWSKQWLPPQAPGGHSFLQQSITSPSIGMALARYSTFKLHYKMCKVCFKLVRLLWYACDWN